MFIIDGDMKNEQPSRTEYLLGGMAAAAAFLVYLRTLQNGFVNWDDGKYIYKNPHIHSITPAFLKWAFFSFYFGNWHPLTLISYALDHALWGAKPMGYHLTNIILHSANAFLVVVLSARLIEAWEKTRDFSSPSFLSGKGKLIAAAATGLLFGLHPLHVESVAWASERKDVLCAFFFLLSIIAYLRYADRIRSAGKPGGFEPWYLLSLFSLVLALMSKPMAVSLPVALLILDWCPLGRIFSLKSFRAVFYEKLPFIALCAGDSALTILAQKRAGYIRSLKSFPFFDRVLVASGSLVMYLWKMAFPLNLVPYYPYPKTISFLYFFSVIFLVIVTSSCLLAMAKNQKLWLACWGYYLITLLPVLGIIQVGKQAMADRYSYLPSIGPFFAAGVAAAWAWRKAVFLKRARLLKMAGASAAVIVFLVMGYLTFRQIGIWNNDIVFWNFIIKKEPGKIAFAYSNRGNVFYDEGRLKKAYEDYSEAIATDPSFAPAYNNQGLVLEKTGQIKMAIADFNKAIALNPSYFPAHFNLARLFQKNDRLDMAISEYSKAIVLDPSYLPAYESRGLVFAMEQKFALALCDFNKAIILNPGRVDAYFNRGRVYMLIGRKGHAASDFKKACSMGDEDGCRALRQMGFNVDRINEIGNAGYF